MPQKIFVAKNGARYVKLKSGRCRFVSGPKKGHRKRKRKVGGSASVGGSAKVGGGIGITRAYRAVNRGIGRASKAVNRTVAKALY